MNSLIKKLTEARQVEEMLRTSAQLAAQNRCPVCGEKLAWKMCGCFKGWGKLPDEYCPTCQDSRWIEICPNAPHLGA